MECSDSALARRGVLRFWSLLIAVLVTACGTDSSQSSPGSAANDPERQGRVVAIALDEFSVTGPSELDAGPVTLAVENDGTMNHQLSIVTADSYESLPRRANGSVIIEELDESRVVLVTDALFAGFPATSFTVELDPGTYVFFCALQSPTAAESHVRLGQRRIVTVP